jgi:hypothetical protein
VYSSRCDLHAPSRRRPGQSACTAGTACDATCKIPRAKDSERAGGMAQGVVARTDSTSSRARPDQTPAVTQSSIAMWPSTWCGQRRCGNGNTALKQCAGLGASCSGCHSNTTVLINSRDGRRRTMFVQRWTLQATLRWVSTDGSHGPNQWCTAAT